jgi:hypothetical protein
MATSLVLVASFLASAPSQAAFANGAVTAGSVTLDNTATTIAARIGQQVSVTLTGDVAENTTTNPAQPGLSIAVAFNAQPSGSTVVGTLTADTAIGSILTYANPGLTYADSDGTQTSDTSSTAPATINYAGDTNEDVTSLSDEGLGVFTFTPTRAGVYTFTAWNEKDRTITAVSGGGSSTTATSAAALSGTESYKTFSVIVSSGVANVAITAVGGSTFAKGGADGALVKVCTTDSAGNIAIPATGETVTLTPSGTGDISKINGGSDVGATAGAAYNLSAADFGASTGCVFVNIVNATAETISVVASMAGVASKTISLTSRTLTVAAAVPAIYSASATGYEASTSYEKFIPVGTTSQTWRLAGTYDAAAAKYFGVKVTDTTGYVTGYTGGSLKYDQATTLASTGYASFSITSSTTATAQVAYSVIGLSAAGAQETSYIQAKSKTTADGSALTVAPSSVSAIPGAAVTISVTAVDNFGRVYANKTISATSTGRNVRTIAVNAVTNADGVATFTFTDTNSTSALISDTITFTGSGSGTATISYSSANVASTITLTSTGDTDVVAGTTVTDIDASYTGATGTYASASAVVKNSAGSVVAGAPVTFTVTGLTGAEVHTTKATVYTDATGTAVGYISSYATGKATVTATSGTATASDDVYFAQSTDTDARTISAKVTGNVVTATVKDRYGNPVRSAYVWATRTGTVFFGTGSSSTSGVTGLDGTVDFIIGGGAGDVKVQLGSSTAASATFGQSANAAGVVGNGAAALAVDAYVAGTATTDQEGLGGSLSPVGVNSATVAVTVSDATKDAAEAASDAAAEAIDAANAATDAANLAAEAADAATVAAEEARDAADAATAAVEELATQVATLMAALKAQITTLANTVAKIAKKVKA